MAEFFASCAKGLEKLVAAELVALGVKRVRPLSSGVAFFGDMQDAYRACLWLRCASRVLLTLDRVSASDTDTLYAAVYEIPWEEHVASAGAIAIDASGTNDRLRDSRFVAVRVKDALCDRLRELTGERPSVQRERPDVRINIALHGERATVALDLAGEPLHRRGYRVASPAIKAPLRETLAAAMLLSAGYEGSVAMLDPLCGSGTIALEAALLAADRAPGLLRSYWGFTGWLGYESKLWEEILDDADERAAVALEALIASERPLVLASDSDAAAVEVARKSARKAGVERLIDFAVSDVAQLVLPVGLTDLLVAANPPYGERLETAAQLPALYAALAELVNRGPARVQAVVITPDDRVDAFLGTPTKRIDSRNGPLETAIRVWGGADDDVPAGDTVGANSTPRNSLHLRSVRVSRGPRSYSPAEEREASLPQRARSNAPLQEGFQRARSNAPLQETQGNPTPPVASPFANRLRKMAAHRGKWARRTGVSCYRVYDADLPDYKVAIDLYQGAPGTSDEGKRWLHIAEYAPPKDIDPQRAFERLAEVLQVAPAVLEVPTDAVYLKQRVRSKGGSQYADTSDASGGSGSGATGASGAAGASGSNGSTSGSPTSGSPAAHLISENGLTFEVDLASRLDTGIFLDHRMTRALLREKARGLDCLNLFAYTGTASVYLADGAAKSVTSVDLSKTYLDWAERNMRNNGFRSGDYRFEQADVLRWVQDTRHLRGRDERRFGLVFVDVPTFSNSERMGTRTWDVQRDHAELLIAVSRLLTAGGLAVFSTNLRGFKPDAETLKKAQVLIEDISARTIPPDFERNQKVHHCYLVRRG